MPLYSTGYELILNACEGALQIAVTNDEQPVCFQEWFLPKRATELLAPALAGIFRQLGIEARVFRRIGCFAGPGSFTGIRLVLATAAALRRATRAQLARLDYLQALATTAVMRRGALYPAKVFVITHARRDLVHFQEFCSYGPQIPAQPVAEVTLTSPEEARGAIDAAGPCLAAGSALGRHAGVFGVDAAGSAASGSQAGAIFMPGLVHPGLAALCLLARHGDYFPDDVEPKYVRGCDAAENLEEKAGPESGEIQAMQALLSMEPRSQI